MALDYDGILQSINLMGTEAYIPLYAYMREVFINEAPLLNRLPRFPAEAEEYNIITYDVRPNAYTLNAAITAGAGAGTVNALVLVDATPLLPGDVLELSATGGATTERVEVQGGVYVAGLEYASTDGITVNVLRGVEGTTVVANDKTGFLTLNLIGNSRTGAEINQGGTRSTRTAIPQQVQTYQMPVTIGGKAQAVKTVALPNGVPDIFTMEQRSKMTEFERDVEKGFYYGIGQRPVNPGDRAKQAGLKKLISYFKGGANVKTGAGGSYTKLNFIRDGFQAALNGGGEPDLCLCSTDFMSYLSTWLGNQQFFAGGDQTALGVSIRAYAVAFLPEVITFVPSYQLRPGTAIILTSKDLKVRYLRQESFIRRGIRGDAAEGDFLGDFAIELGHPSWHAWVQDITGAA